MVKRKKTKVPHPFIIKFILISLFAAAVSAGACYGAIYLLRHNDYFRIRSVVIDPALQFVDKSDLRNLLGQNIFDIDLKAAQRKLSRIYPQASDLKVAKHFPDQIAVVAKQRFPLAQIQIQDKIVVLDEQSVVLSIGGEKDKKLPLVVGVNLSNQKIVRGLPFSGAGIDTALAIAEYAQKEKSLSSYTIEQINIENLSKIHLTLSNKLDVIVDREKLERRMKVLGVVLADEKFDLKQTNYVDLRFKEPVIGKK